MSAAKPLKVSNLRAIWGVIIFDVIILTLLELSPQLAGATSLSNAALFRVAVVGAAPVVVLLLNSLLPASWKAVLVFWRVRHVLPGHRAFSHHAHSDPRIDVAKLQKNVGDFPDAPSEQNAKWYGLMKKVENELAIAHAHGQYLLLRDVAALSLLLATCLLVAGSFGLVSPTTLIGSLGLFSVQFLFAAIGARGQGTGLVTSVLALHSVKRRV
jgi:hypothetical protein